MRLVLTTSSAVKFQTSIALALGLSVQVLARLRALGNGCSKQLPVETVPSALLLHLRVRPEMVAALSLCTLTVQVRGLSAPVRARLRALDSGQRRLLRVAMG